MHKIVSISLDEQIVDLLDDEIIREPDCYNRSQLIRKIIQQYFADKGNETRKIENENQLRRARKRSGYRETVSGGFGI